MHHSSLRHCLLAASLAASATVTLAAQQAEAPPVFRTSVRRVIVDVVVTDKSGKPVPGLTRNDFSILDDNSAQKILSFDANGFDKAMDYTPPHLPAEPPNTFVNLPSQPEKGPLYVLLYDMVNMETTEEQSIARQQLVHFIQAKPEGTRFAIFVFSDGLHMVQGFTSDKSLLFSAIDPQHSRPHVPRIFLMGRNFGQGDAPTAVWVLRALASYLDGLPGRKNVIWLSGGFPLALFADDRDNLNYAEDVKQTIDLLARNQIAIYPVDSRGVAVDNPHDAPGAVGDANPYARAGSPGAGAAAASASAGIGASQLSNSYFSEDDIAQATGGRAFYSRNDISVALEQATEDGSSYYTLSYDPGNRPYDGRLHSIRVDLAAKGYTLAYRRSYYALDPNAPRVATVPGHALPSQEQQPQRPAGDALSANMQSGAPVAHSLLFGAHLQPVGAPTLASAAQMQQLAEATASFRTTKHKSSTRPLTPVKLQQYTIDYTIMTHQLQLAAHSLSLEIAAAAYDNEGRMLNAVVSDAQSGSIAASANLNNPPKSLLAQQQLFAPPDAATIRVAVHDVNTDRIGAMEINLPLPAEPPAPQQTHLSH